MQVARIDGIFLLCLKGCSGEKSIILYQKRFLSHCPGHWCAWKESQDSEGAPTVLAIKKAEVNENPGSHSQREIHRHSPPLKHQLEPFSASIALTLQLRHYLSPLIPGLGSFFFFFPSSDVQFKPHSNLRHACCSSPTAIVPGTPSTTTHKPLSTHSASTQLTEVLIGIGLGCRILSKSVSCIGKKVS